MPDPDGASSEDRLVVNAPRRRTRWETPLPATTAAGSGSIVDEVEGTVLTVLRRHTIAAFNGTQVACSHCRAWMENDEWRRHQAELVARAIERLTSPVSSIPDAP
jgi:hypothetical protein